MNATRLIAALSAVSLLMVALAAASAACVALFQQWFPSMAGAAAGP